MKPLIGITANLIKDSQLGISAQIGGPGQTWQVLADDYIRAVSLAGGIPVVLPVFSQPEEAEAFVGCLDGIVFSGGCSMSPLYYNGNVIPGMGEVCKERDEQELVLVRSALNAPGLPILGICRGCQLLNVAMGGSLIPDIDTNTGGNHFLPEQRMNVPVHRIEAEEGSMLKKILGEENRVNSYHHQCIGRPGELAKITARDENGVPEGIEIPAASKFILGVQWHPEGLACDYEGHAKIFKAFIHAAAEYKKTGR